MLLVLLQNCVSEKSINKLSTPDGNKKFKERKNWGSYQQQNG
jgi:hypothetical protein